MSERPVAPALPCPDCDHGQVVDYTRHDRGQSSGAPATCADLRLPALCQSCGERGPMRPLEEVRSSGVGKEPWCKCGPEKLGGPYIAPPGTVICFTFETKDAAAFRETCRLASNAERVARDRLSERFVKCGRGYRELPKTSAKRRMLERCYRAALRALEALQAECSHPSRSIFHCGFCDVCHAHVQSDVEHYRHFVREAGVRFARRVAC